MRMNTITVLLAEDHQMVREGLRTLLELEGDIEIVGEAKNGPQAVAFSRKACPDVVIMDIDMPLLNGLEATRRILQAQPSTKVLVLSVHRDDAYVERAMAFGASGYLAKPTAAHHLPMAIREVHKGKTFVTWQSHLRKTP